VEAVPFWSLGGPTKGRVRVVEDAGQALRLAASFTVGLVFRPGTGGEPGHDSLLLGHDNKHWLALRGGERTLCSVDAEAGRSFDLQHVVPTGAWSVVFLQSRDDGTAVYVFDDEGLLELGVVGLSLVGSRLRSLGWASNEIQVAQLALWQRCLHWGEMAGSLPRAPPPEPPATDPEANPRRGFRGQVVDTSGRGLGEVAVSWPTGGCVTDEDGCFLASLSDAETDAPESESAGSAGSADSWLSLSFAREGYAPAAVPAQGTPGRESSLRVTLRPVSASASFSAEEGGSVVDTASGSSVAVPPNSLAYPDGTPASGRVTVSLSVIDATDPASLASMPGDFSAVGEDGSEVFLQSLGAAWVGAADEAGRKLVLGPTSEGVTVDLRSNAAADAEKLGTPPDMWTFDEASGKWEQEPAQLEVNGKLAPNPARPAPPAATPSSSAVPKRGVGKKRGRPKKKGEYKPEGVQLETGCMSPEDFKAAVARPGPKSFKAVVTKLGYINCDLAYHHPQRAVMLTGRVLGPGGEPLQHTQLWSVGLDYQGRTPDATDAEGRFGAMIAQFDSELNVEVHVRSEVSDDTKLEVYFEGFPRSLDREAKRLLEAAVGPHKRQTEQVNGQPAWANMAKGSDVLPSQIAWCTQRHQWQHTVGGRLLFVRTEDAEPPALPFGPGWQAAVSFLPSILPAKNIAAPTYARAVAIEQRLVGPFRTGPPGEFVDLGELVVA